MATHTGAFRDSMLITAVVARCSHPKVGQWIDKGTLTDIEYVVRDYDLTGSLVFTFKNKQTMQINLPHQNRAGSMLMKDLTLLDNIKAALTDENVAKMALLLKTGE